jgi:hypothetical protein
MSAHAKHSTKGSQWRRSLASTTYWSSPKEKELLGQVEE